MTLVGFGRTEITPPLGTPLRGYYHERLADRVLDPLYARAIVWGDRADAIVIVTCDLCMIDASWGDAARQAAARAAEVDVGRVLLCATHTHLAPEPVPDIAARLPDQVAQAVRMAAKDRKPCQISRGRTRVPGIAFNRRYRMRDGSVQTNPFGHEEMIERPAGPVNEQLGALCFEDEAGRVRGLLAHFALHADTIGGCGVSADWPGLIEAELRAARADETLHVQMLIGPCGDVNHFDFHRGHAVKGIEEARTIACALASGVERSLRHAQPATFQQPQARGAEALLPLYGPSAAETRNAQKLLAGHRDDPARDFVLEIVAAKKVLRAAKAKGKPLRIPLQVFDFGPRALLAVPMEVFVEVGSAIENDTTRDLWIVTLANGYAGYLPSSRAFGEGGYEVASSVLAPDAPGQLIAEARKLVAGERGSGGMAQGPDG